MSRRTVSQSCEFHAQAMAPGTWPSWYALVSTSTSTMRIEGSVACSAVQAVLTSVSGWAYSGMSLLLNPLIISRNGSCWKKAEDGQWKRDQLGLWPARAALPELPSVLQRPDRFAHRH